MLRNRKDLGVFSNLPTVDFTNVIALEKKTTTRKASGKPKIVYE